MAELGYNAIRTGIVTYLIAELDWLTAANCLDYSPNDAEVMFGALPLVVVDYDYSKDINWVAVENGYVRGIPFMLELFVEIPKSDPTFGRATSEELATKLNDLENVFVACPSIGGLVKNSDVTSSKLELMQLRAVKLGVLARWAWFSLTTLVVT